ncbi:MAG TPA: hypothetical protein GX013_09995, partial [Propionibacterium sp.]|nr:hypothetical protein [Propionibacterium sp.]
MSDETPHRAYGLGDEPEFDDALDDDEYTAALNVPNEWLREAKIPPAV